MDCSSTVKYAQRVADVLPLSDVQENSPDMLEKLGRELLPRLHGMEAIRLAQGFLMGALPTLPDWMLQVIAAWSTSLQVKNEDYKQLVLRRDILPILPPDALRLARQWWRIALGWTDQEAIEQDRLEEAEQVVQWGCPVEEETINRSPELEKLLQEMRES